MSNGSQKQIEWADKIKATAIPVIDAAIAMLQGAATPDTAAKVAGYIAIAENMKLSENAQSWIEYRDYMGSAKAFLPMINKVAKGMKW